MDIFSLFGNACSIVGLGLSIWLTIQTGKIKENVDKALERNNKVINYINMRDDILKELQECAKYLIEDHPAKERLSYLQKLDGCLAVLEACYPNMTSNIKKDVDDVRNSCNDTHFSFIKIIKPLNNIISLLKMEALNYD